MHNTVIVQSIHKSGTNLISQVIKNTDYNIIGCGISESTSLIKKEVKQYIKHNYSLLQRLLFIYRVFDLSGKPPLNNLKTFNIIIEVFLKALALKKKYLYLYTLFR